MIPWNGNPDNLIDRFDGRALLDMYREIPHGARQRQLSADDETLEEVGHMVLVAAHNKILSGTITHSTAARGV